MIGFNASLDGSQETPPVTTTGSGTAYARLDSNLSSLTYRITYAQLSSAFTASDFHLGAYGVTGGVAEAITTTYVGNTMSGTWSNIPDSTIINLVRGNIYINVHSTLHPGGEIRGQLWMDNGVGLSADLDGSQDTPPAAVSSSGTSWLVFANDTLKFQITFAGLTAKFAAAHFHYGDVGVSGPVIHPLSFTDSTLSSWWAGMDDTTTSNLVNGELYINVHTSNYPNGEIRGQVIQMGTNLGIPTAVKDKPKAVPSQFALSQNYPNPFNPSTTITWQLATASKVKLKIYDILGNEVTTLVNEFQQPGVHQISFSTQLAHKQLASGIYFYQFRQAALSQQRRCCI